MPKSSSNYPEVQVILCIETSKNLFIPILPLINLKTVIHFPWKISNKPKSSKQHRPEESNESGIIFYSGSSSLNLRLLTMGLVIQCSDLLGPGAYPSPSPTRKER